MKRVALLLLCVLAPVLARAQVPQEMVRGQWRNAKADSNEYGYGPMRALDGNANTFWNTEFNKNQPAQPHEISFEAAHPLVVSGFRYLPQQNGSAEGRIARYDFQASMDGTNWESAGRGHFEDSANWQTGLFEKAVSGKFFKLTAWSSTRGDPLTVVAEMEVFADRFVTDEPRNYWSVKYVDSFQPREGDPRNAIDGDPKTYWHTQYSPKHDPLPHQFQVDMHKTSRIAGFTYLPRSDNFNGRIAEYEFYAGMDGGKWGEPLAKGTFPNNKELQKVMFAHPVEARFLRIVEKSEVAGQPFGAIAELDVIYAK